MPQPPSPSMGIIWPTDKDDANQWDVIMDTAVRVVIDGHNHAAGNGAKVSISQLAFDADISFVDSLGGKHAITDLKAIDFFPIDPTTITALAGALFVNNADNELYFRTVLGTNVKFTNGATLNVAAFIGGIGGDYTAVQALEVFDDATDAFWFQQQVGVAVRQYAKMRCADLALYEFKAVAAGPPVPVQAVTLRSPTGLAGGYALTFPGAAPGAQTLVQVDSTGLLIFSNTLAPAQDIKHGIRTLQINGFEFSAGSTDATSSYSFSSGSISGAPLSCGVSIALRQGDRILAIRVYISDSAGGPTKLQASFLTASSIGTPSTVGSSAVSAGSGANQTLSITGLTTTVATLTSYLIKILTTTGAGTCSVLMAEIDYDHP